jgi:hypothetical protein
MSRAQHGPQSNTLWAYAYELGPAQDQGSLHEIEALLDREHVDAEASARVWTGRLVLGRHATHILIVSDSPRQNHEVNHRLEARLKTLNMKFAVSIPMAVVDDETEPPRGAES